MEEQGKYSAVEYLDWYFKYDDGGADKTAVEAWGTIKTILDELRSLVFEEKYEPYTVEPKFKKLKVPEKCGECRNCNATITRSPYCYMKAASSVDSQMNISSIYVNIDSRPVWCPIVKANDELNRMSFEKRAEFEKLVTGLSSLFGGDVLWE